MGAEHGNVAAVFHMAAACNFRRRYSGVIHSSEKKYTFSKDVHIVQKSLPAYNKATVMIQPDTQQGLPAWLDKDKKRRDFK